MDAEIANIESVDIRFFEVSHCSLFCDGFFCEKDVELVLELNIKQHDKLVQRR